MTFPTAVSASPWPKAPLPAAAACSVELAQLPVDGVLRDDALLFSESQSRLLVTVHPEQMAAFEALFAGQDCGLIGRVIEEQDLLIFGSEGQILVKSALSTLKEAWQAAAAGAVIMSKQVRSIVIAGNGTNCEREVANACRLAGAACDIVHIAELLAGRVSLDAYHFLNLAGGFLDGDDLGSAKAGANRLIHARVAGCSEHLSDQIQRFIAAGKLIMGVCNGFQLMVKMGLLPGLDGDYRQQTTTLTFNDGGRFEDRWTYLAVDPNSPCIYTKGLKGIYLPVRHGEGKFVAENEGLLDRLEGQHLAVLKYADSGFRPTMDYPLNPNGAQRAIAGLCDPTGRVFGLMPHPEAYVHRTHHPRWTREELPEEGMGLWLYQNAVRFIEQEVL